MSGKESKKPFAPSPKANHFWRLSLLGTFPGPQHPKVCAPFSCLTNATLKVLHRDHHPLAPVPHTSLGDPLQRAIGARPTSGGLLILQCTPTRKRFLHFTIYESLKHVWHRAELQPTFLSFLCVFPQFHYNIVKNGPKACAQVGCILCFYCSPQNLQISLQNWAIFFQCTHCQNKQTNMLATT